MIGKTISHYRIVEKLGEGGMGVVYVAEDTVLGRRVAIKTLSAGRAARDPHFRSRFLREARAVSTLSHPHIATIYEYGETEDGQPYIVMELVKGETLGELMLTEKLTIPRALEIVEQVAEALAEAHRQGIVHRDIKPTNVALDHRGEVKVLDFGLAKQIPTGSIDATDPERQTLLNTQTQEGVVVGTPMYLSPEQALGVEVDARSDLFSLGGLLYECIAGKPPFSGRTPGEICAKVIRDDPPPPSRSNANVPKELDRIALKAMAKKPEARYQTAEEMIADLQAARVRAQSFDQTVTRMIETGPGAHPTGTLATLSDIFKRPRVSIGYVVAALIVVAVIGFAAWRLTRPTPHQPTAEAQRLYDKALDAMREGAFFRASKILQQAVQDDDRFALAHARLAEAWTELDFSDKAKDELLRAHDLVPDRSILPGVDALRLQAVTDTVQQDFAKAVEDYRGLASQVPLTDKAYAVVDLGRAYEKNEQPDKAIESYREATQLNPHYAAAFLRLSVVLGRRQQFDDAFKAYDQAYNLFDVASEIEGMAEVLLQRGILLGQQGKATEGRQQLLLALDKSSALENKDKQIRTMLSLSYNSFVAGDSAQAEQYSTQALQLAQANGIENLTAAGLIDLGTAHLARGDFKGADSFFNQALRLAQMYKGRRNEARALLSLASLRSQEDNPDAVPDLVKRALLYYEQGGHRKETSQAYTILGRSYRQTGNYDAAQKAFEQQLQSAQQANDPQQIALAQEGLGSVFDRRQQYPEALAHYDEHYRINKELHNTLNIGYAAMNRGSELRQLGKFDAAEEALSEALPIGENAGHEPNKDLLAAVWLNKAWLAFSEGKLSEAAALSQKALDLSQADYKVVAVRAGSLLGLTQSANGQTAAGRQRCADAVNIARTLRDPLWLSDALVALAETSLAAGDTQAALNAANEAQQRLTPLKQLESEWRAWLVMARASEKSGDKQGAQRAGLQARTILATLERQWGGENYKLYLSRSDVIERRKQLEKIES